MKNHQWSLVCFVALSLSACAAQKTLLLTAPAVSMTDASIDPPSKLSPKGEIKSQYCTGEEAQSSPSSSGDLNVGLMDELVYKAQKESGARYIANAQFFSQGNCMILEGTVIK